MDGCLIDNGLIRLWLALAVSVLIYIWLYDDKPED